MKNIESRNYIELEFLLYIIISCVILLLYCTKITNKLNNEWWLAQWIINTMIYNFQLVILIIENQGGHQHPRDELSRLKFVVTSNLYNVTWFFGCVWDNFLVNPRNPVWIPVAPIWNLSLELFPKTNKQTKMLFLICRPQRG